MQRVHAFFSSCARPCCISQLVAYHVLDLVISYFGTRGVSEVSAGSRREELELLSVSVTVIFRRFFDDTGSPVVECCLKPVVPSVQKVFVPSENVIAPLQSLHRRQSMTLLGSTLQIQQPDFKLFQDTVSPTRHERYRKTSKECKCPVLNANGC